MNWIKGMSNEELKAEFNVLDRIAHERDEIPRSIKEKIEALELMEKINNILKNENAEKVTDWN